VQSKLERDVSIFRIISISFLVLCLSSSAFAAESWDCSYVAPGEPWIAKKHGTVEITDKDIYWKLDEIDFENGKMSIPSTSVRYSLVENNEVGAVGVHAAATIEKLVGSDVGADVLLLDKVKKTLRIGLVGMYPSHDLLTGICRPK
jgi:hypothetical protein